MTAGYLPRSAWNARPRGVGGGVLDPRLVEGIAFHWPGTTTDRPISKAAVPRALRSWQDYHMDGHRWSDIAYQVAIDQWGRRWTLRGLTRMSAANGDSDVNRRFGAVLLVLVRGERPTPEMIDAARATVRDFRELFPNAAELVGHGEIRPGGGTECPGTATLDAIHAGQFEPANQLETEDDDMPTPADFWNHPIPHLDPNAKNDERPVRVIVAETHKRAGDARALAAAAHRQATRNRAALAAMAESLEPSVRAAVIGALGEEIKLTLTIDPAGDSSPPAE